MFVEGKSRTVFFRLQTLLFTAFLATVQKIITYACEHMILGQLRMGARQTNYAPLFSHIHNFGWFRQLSHIFFACLPTQSIYEAIFRESNTLIICLLDSARTLSRLIIT